MFHFDGVLSASKSILNRALVIQSYFPELEIRGESQAQDVTFLRNALSDLKKSEFQAGEGGTTFRFLVLRLSREIGSFKIFANPTLLKRPQGPLKEILRDFGVQVETHEDHWIVTSKGWQEPKGLLKISGEESTQFLSSVFLNSWKLPFDLQILVQGELKSEPYFQMTLQIVKSLGLSFSQESATFLVPAGQLLQQKTFVCEPDLSSAFSLAACAVTGGSVSLHDFPQKSLQADIKFLDIFSRMGLHYHLENGQFKIRQQKVLKPVQTDLKSCPDLFPVLACLCVLAPGKSVLYGAPHLKFKESDRIAGVADLLTQLGFQFSSRPDGLEIFGDEALKVSEKIQYDPKGDHRLAMAAQVLVLAGYPIEINNKDCVNKSFPEFWKIVGSAC